MKFSAGSIWLGQSIPFLAALGSLGSSWARAETLALPRFPRHFGPFLTTRTRMRRCMGVGKHGRCLQAEYRKGGAGPKTSTPPEPTPRRNTPGGPCPRVLGVVNGAAWAKHAARQETRSKNFQPCPFPQGGTSSRAAACPPNSLNRRHFLNRRCALLFGGGWVTRGILFAQEF